MDDLAFRSAVDLAAAIRERRLGSLELLEHYLARIDRYNPALNAIVVMDRDRARERARKADAALARGEVWGPLHGVTMTVKESYDVAGMPTTWGVPELAGNVPTRNAVVVDRLQAAGAIIVGKTNVPLMLGDWQTFNAIHGATRNPWDTTRTPGGSSGGAAAALAAGLVGLEAGSDIGASIRNPAHYCGVYGHKPTFGIVPGRGQALPGVLAVPDIAVVGPMARSAEDLATALDVMAGPDLLDAVAWRLALPAPRRTALRDYRVAVMLDDPVCPVDRDVADRLQHVADTLAHLGASVSDRARPAIDTARSHSVYLHLLRAVTTAGYAPALVEAARRTAEAASADDRSYVVEVARGTVMSHRQWILENEERVHLQARWAEFFERVDVLLCPAAPTTAFPHDQGRPREERTITVNGRQVDYNAQLFWAGLSGVVYLPSTVAPAGRAPGGLPVGIQIVGPHLGDRTTIDFARLLAVEIGGFAAPPGFEG